MTLHPRAACLFALLDPDWRAKVFRGGLILLVQPIGWPAILGYRAALARHLFGNAPVPLPPWRGHVLTYFLGGVKAMAVIFGHLLPLYVVLAVLATQKGFVPGRDSLLAALFFLAFPIFSTLSFPFACLVLAGGGFVTAGEAAALLVAFAAIVFLIPAGFLRVSCTGRYLSAFELWRTVPFVLRHLRAYANAWWHAGWISLAGHLAFPLSPWGVVWAYLAIIFLFNEILVHAGEAPGRGWLERAIGDPLGVRPAGGGLLARVTDARGESAAILQLGESFAAPLPRLRRPRTPPASGILGA